MKFNLKLKVIIAFLLLSLNPIALLAYFSIYTIKESGRQLINQTISELEREEEEKLIKQAEYYAKRVSTFLKEREKDLLELASMKLEQNNIMKFWQKKKSKVWYGEKKGNVIIDRYEMLPLYKEIAVIDKEGNEVILLKDGKIVGKEGLRNVKKPANTTYKNEDYFLQTMKLKEGEIYVSSLKGFAMTKKDQIGDTKKPEDVGGGKRYDGVIRFSMPLFKNGSFDGILTIALDHIHLQELSIHLVPGYGEIVNFSSYESGNYAFIFDHNGWIITHPKYWDFPGVWKDGTEKKYMSEKSTKKEIEEGILGFNLDYAGFLSEGYPKAASDVRKKKSGIVTVTNVGGIKKVMAYAPIIYDTKPFNKYGIFGGFTLGANFDEFVTPAKKAENALSAILRNYEKKAVLLFFAFFVFVSILGYAFSKHITEPVVKLAQKIPFIGEIEFENWEKIKRSDEIGELAEAFYNMNQQINKQKKELLNSMKELEKTKKMLEEYNLYLKQKIELLKDEEFRRVDKLSSIGQLASGIAHEIRNPLTGVMLMLDDLHDRIKDIESKELIAAALHELERLERLVAMLLDFASPKTNVTTLINVDSMLDEIFLLVKKMCDKKHINVERKRLLIPGFIKGDLDKMKQAFLNIILNAIQHTYIGGKITIESKLEIAQGRHYIVVSVSDTGPGIKEADIEKIFEPFYTLREGGTGLGLAISKSIINEHNGTIFAKNTENGAVFEVWLPEERT
jgi:signal transduction histidine kinase